ncbi:MAG: hypothetical protein QQN41_08805 [Nitrosopumilus sp.]
MKEKIVKWLLRQICKRIVVQSSEHQGNITEYYRIMWESARKEFCEDTGPILQSFMRECHEESMNFDCPANRRKMRIF